MLLLDLQSLLHTVIRKGEMTYHSDIAMTMFADAHVPHECSRPPVLPLAHPLYTARTKSYFHQLLHQRLDAILKTVKPQQKVVFALDGPAPLAKLLEQRFVGLVLIDPPFLGDTLLQSPSLYPHLQTTSA